MKVETFNINGINRRLGNLSAWLKQAKPDIVCLQELKAPDEAFPETALNKLGYDCVWVGQPSWNGVAILSKLGEPVVTRKALPGDPSDHQARYIEAAVAGILIASIYAPNGNPQPGPKFSYKLDWLKRLHAHATALRKAGAPILLAGDFNVVPTDFDIYETKSMDDNALVQPESRVAFRKLLGRSWTDALRHLHPDDPKLYTFWDYKRLRWQRDAGMRLDHFLLSANLVDRLEDGGVDRDVRGKESASDHAPAWIRLSRD